MANFAKIGINNKVISIEMVHDSIATSEKDGIRFLTNLTKYPLWKQSNITQAGGDELTKMKTFIDAVRAWANQDPLPDPWDGTLEAITP